MKENIVRFVAVSTVTGKNIDNNTNQSELNDLYSGKSLNELIHDEARAWQATSVDQSLIEQKLLVRSTLKVYKDDKEAIYIGRVLQGVLKKGDKRK